MIRGVRRLPIAVLAGVALRIVAAPHETFQDDADTISKFIVTSWTSGEGLPVNEIEDLKETPDGYLWLGTHQGLVRFDGLRFQTFFAVPTGLRYGTRVGPLELDARGRLWTAADEVGLLYLEDGKFNEVLTNGAVLGSRVVSLCSDGTNGIAWVDSSGALGLVSIDNPNEAELLKGGRATPGSYWIRGAQGNLWLINPRNVKFREKNHWRDVPIPGSATLVATARRAGGLWVAREARLRIVNRDGTSLDMATVPWRGQSRVQCMLEDSKNRLWIGTVGQGIYCFADGKFEQVVPSASSIMCLLEDSNGSIWAGTRGAGLVRVRQREFFVEGLGSGMHNEYVRSLAEDASGRIWIVTAESGLGWWRDGAWTQMGELDGWGNFDAVSVAPSKNGGVWISTTRRGLWNWAEGKLTRQPWGKGPRETPMDLLEDRKGRLWMVTDNSGLYCLDGGRLRHYGTEEGLPSSLMRCVVEDQAGVIWAGDWQGGIARLRNDNSWEIVRQPSGHGDAVRTMVADEGVLWIGTSAGGLLRFKDGKTDRVSGEQGLPDGSIRQLLLDGQGSLWGGTPHQLFRLWLGQLNEVMDGREERVQPVLYGRGAGLPDVSFASWNDPRSWRSSSGEMWFGTANGAIHFRPAEMGRSRAPQMVIEKLLLNGKVVPAEQLRAMRPGAQRVEIHFSAPCLTAPDRVWLKYRLDGVDTDWVDAGPARVATYGSIPAGRHEFRVMACSPDGEWPSQIADARIKNPKSTTNARNELNIQGSQFQESGTRAASTASVILVVQPYLWQTSWFLAGSAALFAGGAVWVVRRATVRRLSRRLEVLRRQHTMDLERERIARDIHDELGASLTTIGLLADMARRRIHGKAQHPQSPAHSPPAALASDTETKTQSSGLSVQLDRDLNEISRTARESVSAMDAIVWAVNPRNDSLDHFANYVAQFTREFFRPTGLRTRLNLPADLPSHPLASETRHQLFLLVKESFNNIARHADATEVRLELACNNGDLRLIIADNGKGLSAIHDSPSKNPTETLKQNTHDSGPRTNGNGLTNLRSRIERLGGTMRIESAPGQGLRLEFKLPLEKSVESSN